jgi:predicted ATPase/class 3 adenylate cyclase
MEAAGVTAFLFTDIEGSTGLWEAQPGRMREALARHDAIARALVEQHRGSVVKMTGDGVHAAFVDPLDALLVGVALQRALEPRDDADALPLAVRCGIHAGVVERRDNDYFGSAVNRAARIMGIAHAGQILVSQAVSDLVSDRLPQGLSLVPLGAVQLRGLSTAEPLHQVVHPALRRDFPPPRALAATPNNLPRQVTSFIGREQDLTLLEALVQRARLVTIVGTGGLGKTRLALELAHRALDAFPDGAWFVDLAAIGEPSMVPLAVASALSLTEVPSRTIEETLVAHVRDRRTLIVLDNCEHLAHACASLAHALLRDTAAVTIVATSREPLHVAGEAVHALSTLSLPAPTDDAPEALMRTDAVRLFSERAIAGHPAFAVTPANASAVATICRRVDGIPLALELAAARMRSLSPVTLATRLDDRFRVLTAGDRTALPRQQTLRALIDWSHDLLEDAERVLFRRLGVFAGGFTLAACEAVCDDEALPAGEVIDVLSRLVDKSLVEREPAAEDRYRLLETIRQYASERLEQAGETAAMRERHLHHHVALAEAVRPRLTGAAQGQWLARLDADRENFLAAHAWGASMGDPEASLRLMSALRRYWILRGLLALGYRVTLEALARSSADTIARCDALFDAGQLASYMGRYAEAEGYLAESLRIARSLEDRERIAAVLQPLGLTALAHGDCARAREFLLEGLDLAEALGKPFEVAAALNALAQIARTEGDLAGAEPLYERALAVSRQHGFREIVAVSLLNRAMVALDANAGARSRSWLLEVFDIAAEIGSKPVAQSLLEVGAGYAASRQRFPDAARLLGAAAAHAELTGLTRDPADEAFVMRVISRTRQSLGEDAFVAAERAGRSLDLDGALANMRALLSEPPSP